MALLMLLAILASVIGGLVVQIRCTDSASAIARQAARGDSVAVGRLQSEMPRGASVSSSSDATTVTVTVTAPMPILDGRFGTVQLSATATAVKEPGR